MATTPRHLRGLIGGDTDTHGCLTGAGYTWCEGKGKCVRVWEEACPTADSHFCAAGLVWCDGVGKCVRPWLCTSALEDVTVSPPGGDSDAHGCKASAGYTWCQGESSKHAKKWHLMCRRHSCCLTHGTQAKTRPQPPVAHAGCWNDAALNAWDGCPSPNLGRIGRGGEVGGG
jgi:hypothetical protein